jgi:ATP-dependent Clp protease protease subunit
VAPPPIICDNEGSAEPNAEEKKQSTHRPSGGHVEDQEKNESPPTRITDSVRDRLFKARTLIISGEINHLVAANAIAQLIAMSTESEDPISMFINSPGGHVESGDTVHDVVRFIKPRVRMIGTGWVASAGALIYIGAPLEDRYCLPNTRFLLHQPSGGGSGSASDIEIEAREILKMRERINRLFSRETGQTLARIEDDTRRNFWLDAEHAKEYGLVGKIINSMDEVR